MAISQYEFWYDRQIVRFLEQLVRAFSGFSYQTGSIAGQPPQTLLVPCRIASTNRMVANLMANLSENTLQSVPLITVYQSGLTGRREDLQNTEFVDRLQVYERNIGPNGKYGTQPGNAYSVDRLMPLPFTMEVQVDIWTSNLQQKYMLIEQILPVIYPQFEIQNSDNALDWTAVTLCMVDDDFTFSSRTIPIGTSDEIDVATIKLRIPIWLSAPAKVKRIGRIEEVVVDIDDGQTDPMSLLLQPGLQYQQVVVSPDDACVHVDGVLITLLGPKHASTHADGSLESWTSLLSRYGSLRPTLSKIKLYISGDIEGAFVTGSVQYTGAINQLTWTIDASTLPANTIPAINAVIDPLRSYPGHNLASVADGQRYLLVNDLGNSVAWGSLSAKTNDIIQYSTSTSTWSVVFAADNESSAHYVLNAYTGRQLRWTGSSWAMAIDGVYEPGFWRLVL